MFKTRVTELYGIDYPVVQGGLMWMSRAELVSAVANAGGIGFMTALTFPTPEELGAEIRKTRTMTDKPFGVNFSFLPTLKTVDYDSYIDVCIDEGIKFVRLDANNLATTTTYFFKEVGLLIPKQAGETEQKTGFVIQRETEAKGTIELYNLVNVATGQSFEFDDVPVKKLDEAAGWVITDEGWVGIRDRLQGRMEVKLMHIKSQ